MQIQNLTPTHYFHIKIKRMLLFIQTFYFILCDHQIRKREQTGCLLIEKRSFPCPITGFYINDIT